MFGSRHTVTYEVVPQYMVHCILKVEAVIDLNGNIPRKLLHIGVCSLFYVSTIGPTVYQKQSCLLVSGALHFICVDLFT